LRGFSLSGSKISFALHRRFAKQNIKGGFGTEWFKVSADEIAKAAAQ